MAVGISSSETADSDIRIYDHIHELMEMHQPSAQSATWMHWSAPVRRLPEGLSAENLTAPKGVNPALPSATSHGVPSSTPGSFQAPHATEPDLEPDDVQVDESHESLGVPDAELAASPSEPAGIPPGPTLKQRACSKRRLADADVAAPPAEPGAIPEDDWSLADVIQFADGDASRRVMPLLVAIVAILTDQGKALE